MDGSRWTWDHGKRFWVRQDGRWLTTPLFFVLILIETMDVVFAVDSIPAIFAVTTEPFLVFTSNAFAILGLRSLYLLLADLMHRFIYLKAGLSAILAFVGAKMLLLDVVKIRIALSLTVIVSCVSVAVVASLRATRAPPPLRASTPCRHDRREVATFAGHQRRLQPAINRDFSHGHGSGPARRWRGKAQNSPPWAHPYPATPAP
jgi:predicted tellurium resistance membrane protein TerC